jgi:hypothetical protein
MLSANINKQASAVFRLKQHVILILLRFFKPWAAAGGIGKNENEKIWPISR